MTGFQQYSECMYISHKKRDILLIVTWTSLIWWSLSWIHPPRKYLYLALRKVRGYRGRKWIKLKSSKWFAFHKQDDAKDTVSRKSEKQHFRHTVQEIPQKERWRWEQCTRPWCWMTRVLFSKGQVGANFMFAGFTKEDLRIEAIDSERTGPHASELSDKGVNIIATCYSEKLLYQLEWGEGGVEVPLEK